jgi:hypothetical protein
MFAVKRAVRCSYNVMKNAIPSGLHLIGHHPCQTLRYSQPHRFVFSGPFLSHVLTSTEQKEGPPKHRIITKSPRLVRRQKRVNGKSAENYSTTAKEIQKLRDPICYISITLFIIWFSEKLSGIFGNLLLIYRG